MLVETYDAGSFELDFDPSKYKTKAKAAKALYHALRKAAGESADTEVHLYNPDDSRARGRGRVWGVSWESGPYQWAVAASLSGMWNRDAGWYTEPYYNFDLYFYD